MMMKLIGHGLLFALLAWATPVGAVDSPKLATRVEGPGKLERVVIMHVEGNLIIDADGSVPELKLRTAVTPQLASSLDRTIRSWRFYPVKVAGVARRVSTNMRLVLVGTAVGEGYKVHVDSVVFPDRNDPTVARADGDPLTISGKSLKRPGYPPELQMRGVMGTVVLAIRVTADGKVGDLAPVQSLLYNVATGGNAPRRDLALLEKVATSAARDWTFNVPDAESRSPETMTVLVPVQFNLGFDLEKPGQWLSVLRPPARAVSWQSKGAGGAVVGLASASGSSVSPLAGGLQLRQDVAGMSLL